MADPSHSEARLIMSRADLINIIERASFTVPDRTRERLRKLARTTPAVAVGWFHCDGVGCPARQIGYRSQSFQSAYDSAMAQHFELETLYDDGTLSIEPRVVEVDDD